MDWAQYTDGDLERDIIKEYSSRFCAVDALCAVNRLKGESPITCDVIFLQIAPQLREMMHYLYEWKYQNVVIKMIKESRLTENFRILCSPWLSQEDWKLLNDSFLTMRQNEIQYEWRENGLLLMLPEPIIDIVLFPTSQLHGEIMNALQYFGQYVEDGMKDVIYQDLYSPSVFTQFSQSWVADNFKIQINPYAMIV